MFFVELRSIMCFLLPPAMKLWEGNIFSRVCPSVILSFWGEGVHVTIIRDALDLTVQALLLPAPASPDIRAGSSQPSPQTSDLETHPALPLPRHQT